MVRRWAAPRVIMDLDGRSPYLSRYYLRGRPRMPDGSEPFEPGGGTKEGAIDPPGWGLYLHRFHRGDLDRELHNHPWRWSLSLILAGGYLEERRQGDRIVRRRLRPGAINWIGQDDFHRVDLTDGECWSLFVAGPKVSGWGFWDRSSGEIIPWRTFVRRAAHTRRVA